eukprot:5137470-Amphidinium_carterae.1
MATTAHGNEHMTSRSAMPPANSYTSAAAQTTEMVPVWLMPVALSTTVVFCVCTLLVPWRSVLSWCAKCVLKSQALNRCFPPWGSQHDAFVVTSVPFEIRHAFDI